MTLNTPSSLLAEHVRQLRHRYRWTAAELAQRCAEAGHPEITRSVIANIESGRPAADGTRRRRVTVEELLALADVFNAAPGALLAPLDAPETEKSRKPALNQHLEDAMSSPETGPRPKPPVGYTIPELIFNLTFHAAKLSETVEALAEATGATLWDEDGGPKDYPGTAEAPGTLIARATEELRLTGEAAGGDGE